MQAAQWNLSEGEAILGKSESKKMNVRDGFQVLGNEPRTLYILSQPSSAELPPTLGFSMQGKYSVVKLFHESTCVFS